MSQKLLRQGSAKTSHVFYVPRAIADAIPESARFNPEFTAEGVLFRFVGFEDVQPPRVVPEWALGASAPAEPQPNGDEPAKATAAQVTFAQSLLQRGNFAPLDERDLRNMPRERVSALIEALKAGTYDPTEWDVPF